MGKFTEKAKAAKGSNNSGLMEKHRSPWVKSLASKWATVRKGNQTQVLSTEGAKRLAQDGWKRVN